MLADNFQEERFLSLFFIENNILKDVYEIFWVLLKALNDLY